LVIPDTGTIEGYGLPDQSTTTIVLQPNAEVVFQADVMAMCWRALAVHRDGVQLEYCIAHLCQTPYSEPGTYELVGYAHGQIHATVIIVAGEAAPQSSSCRISACLEGARATEDGIMRTDLAASGLLSLSEPYGPMGYSDASSGNEFIDGQHLVYWANDPVVDWVRVELQIPVTGEVIYAHNALLHASGTVRDIAGAATLQFEAPPGLYVLSMRHRNHLRSSTRPIPFPFELDHFDMRLNISYMNTFEDTRVNVGEVMALRGGNARQDDTAQRITYTGPQNDRDQILIRLGGEDPTSVAVGYHPEDVNLDGVVKYVGSNNDREFIGRSIGGDGVTNSVSE